MADTSGGVVDQVRHAVERYERVSADRLHANPWNPNRMDDAQRRATRESMATYGFLIPLLVRPHPDLDGHYQIVDGEHRWTLGTEELGMTEFDCAVAHLDDVTAKKITIVSNNHGDPEAHLLGSLLIDLEAAGDDLSVALAYSEGELEHLKGLAAYDWGEFDPPDEDQLRARAKGANFQMVVAKCPRDFADVWQEACDQARREFDLEPQQDEQLANAQVLQALVARYLGSDGRQGT